MDAEAFRDLKVMTSLDLSENNITKILPKTFDGNDNLETVKLSHNKGWSSVMLRGSQYRVGHLLADLGWVDLDLACSTIMLGQ